MFEGHVGRLVWVQVPPTALFSCFFDNIYLGAALRNGGAVLIYISKLRHSPPSAPGGAANLVEKMLQG